jgi:hypothetical protein
MRDMLTPRFVLQGCVITFVELRRITFSTHMILGREACCIFRPVRTGAPYPSTKGHRPDPGHCIDPDRAVSTKMKEEQPYEL